MFGTQDLGLFILAGLALNLTPGPDTAFILSRSAALGFRGGVVAAMGICSGVLIHVLAASLGLSAILATSSTAFELVKLLGAAYLVYMAIQLWRTKPGGVTGDQPPPPHRLSRVYAQGLMTNVLNPKVALFFLAFLPQFVSTEAPSKALAMIFLGLVFDLNGFLWCLFLAALGARAARALSNAGRLTLWLNRTLGALFIFFAARLALADR